MTNKYVMCPCCLKINIVMSGKDSNNTQRYLCLNSECSCDVFILDCDNKWKPVLNGFRSHTAK